MSLFDVLLTCLIVVGMATVKSTYTAAAAITFTSLASLADNAYAQCLAIDNTTDRYLDASVYLAVKAGAAPTAGSIKVYVYASIDGTNYVPADADGTDSTIASPDANLTQMLILTITTDATSTLSTRLALGPSRACSAASCRRSGASS